jgi:hypothetical protein
MGLELAPAALPACDQVEREEAAHLRSQARRCRRLAENVSSDRDQAMLRRFAREFDEAAEKLEKSAS